MESCAKAIIKAGYTKRYLHKHTVISDEKIQSHWGRYDGELEESRAIAQDQCAKDNEEDGEE